MNETLAHNNCALVVDDHPIVIDALVTSLLALDVFESVDTALSLQDAILRLEKNDSYSLAMLDLHMSDTKGVEAVVCLRERFPDIPVLVFSADGSLDSITTAFDHGVRGFVPKSEPIEVVIAAIRMVLAGSCYIPPKAVELLGFKPPTRRAGVHIKPEASIQFSPRQKQVLRLLLQGMPNKVIASRLEMAEGTVKTHLNSVYTALGVNSRAQAILKAQKLGFRL